MSIHSTFEGAQFLTQASDIAMKNGISLQVGTCFKDYADLIATQRQHQPVGQPFDDALNDFDAGSGFWIAGRNQDGALIHTQAMRILNLQGRPLSGYLAKGYLDFPPAGVDLDLEKSYYHPGPSAHKIHGTVCYHGDFWLSADYRGTGLANVLARFALASGLLKWSPDFIIGFMIRQVAFKGLAEREGYMHSEPGALFWHRADLDQALEAFMVWMANEDLEYLLSIPLQGMTRPPESAKAIAAE